MSRSLSHGQAIVLGLVVLAGLALAGGGLFQVGQRQGLWGPTFEVAVRFAEVPGITVGTPVRVYGVPAGHVVAIDLPADDDPDPRVTLRLRLDQKVQGKLHADASARLANEGLIGTRTVELDPGSRAAGPLEPGATLAAKTTPDMAEFMRKSDELVRKTSEAMTRADALIAAVHKNQDQISRDTSTVLRKVDVVLGEVHEGKGTLGKVVKDEQAYNEMVALLRETQTLVRNGQETMTSVKQDADAIKALPVIRSYVEPGATELLVRPQSDRDRRTFNAVDLFEPGRSNLTDAGKQHLDGIGVWLNGSKAKGSDIVVVGYADPKAPDQAPAAARTLTLKQSEAVVAYLKDRHSVHKMGWFARRKVTPLGLGTAAPPVPEKEAVPAARIEVVLFVPRA